jgi:hypothetical protein
MAIASQSAERGLCIDHVRQTLGGKSIEAPLVQAQWTARAGFAAHWANIVRRKPKGAMWPAC